VTRRRPNQARPNQARPNQTGAALAIALILLVVLTILAIAGATTSTTELAMSGNEQFRRNAAQAAGAGIEQAVTRLGAVPTTAGAGPLVTPPTLMPGSNADRYATSTRYTGDERGLPQSSADKFVGLHYTVESTGTSARNASDTQVQGVMVVAASGVSGDSSFGQIGGGLQ
jgi:Tfp pilus assembly protein PilX